MSKLISGWEAIKAVESGECVEYQKLSSKWYSLNDEPGKWVITDFTNGSYKFRLKPRTITINGIEVPAPVQNQELGKLYYTLVGNTQSGYEQSRWTNEDFTFPFGCWETLDEIQQVLEATQKAFEVQP